MGLNAELTEFDEDLAETVREAMSPVSLMAAHARAATVTGGKYIPDVVDEDCELNRLARSFDIFPMVITLGVFVSAHGEISVVEIQEMKRSHPHRGLKRIYKGPGCEGDRGEGWCDRDHYSGGGQG